MALLAPVQDIQVAKEEPIELTGSVTQVLPAGFDVIPQAISGQLLKIKMRGKLGKGGGLIFQQVPVPAVVEPLRRAMRN